MTAELFTLRRLQSCVAIIAVANVAARIDFVILFLFIVLLSLVLTVIFYSFQNTFEYRPTM